MPSVGKIHNYTKISFGYAFGHLSYFIDCLRKYLCPASSTLKSQTDLFCIGLDFILTA